MRKTAPGRMADTALGSGRLSAVGEALRVLHQVDSELHLARLEETGRALEGELAGEGLAEPARIAERMADLVNKRLRARSALAPRDLRTLQQAYVKLACCLEPPPRAAHPTKHRWARWGARRGDRR